MQNATVRQSHNKNAFSPKKTNLNSLILVAIKNILEEISRDMKYDYFDNYYYRIKKCHSQIFFLNQTYQKKKHNTTQKKSYRYL